MNWLILAFALQLGYTPNDLAVIYTPPPGVYSREGLGIVEMDFEARAWGFLYIGGSIGTAVWAESDMFGFRPERSSFDVRAGIRFGALELGWSHHCAHPTIPYLPIFASTRVLWEGIYDEVHLKISGEFSP